MSLCLEYLELLHIISSVNRNSTVTRYLKSLRAHHESTFIHSLHVATLAVQIAYEYGLSWKRIKTISNAAMLHDIGKCNVPVELMCKPSALTAEEFEIIRRHPIDAYNFVHENMTFDSAVDKTMVEKVCLMHHLKLNGTGYPTVCDGRPMDIDCAEIPLECRIVTVCDIYDAMIEKRPYKKCYSHLEALEELDKMADEGLIDGTVVSLLKKLIDENRLLLQTASLDIRYA